MSRTFLIILVSTILFLSCKEESHKPSVMFGQADTQKEATAYDLEDIQASGELIAATLSSPETYYEYRGEGFGVEYEMAKSFASHIGARLRVEVVQDSVELMHKLTSGEADLVLTVPKWQIRPSSPQLTSALSAWWQDDLRERTQLAERQRLAPRNRIRRLSRPPMLSREKGIICSYDGLFQRYASVAGMDWRLMAAQCYQESAFDPKAVSWAGAQGLMQIMPGTAANLGLAASAVYEPAQNIAAAARYLAELQVTFSDIHERTERLCFVLAAYNGGASHVRDAMALAQQYGGNPHRWNDVDKYILLLSQPRYYRDPVVRAGYLRGSETSDYVRQIMARWSQYRGVAHPAPLVPQKENYKRNTRIRSREEFLNDSIP